MDYSGCTYLFTLSAWLCIEQINNSSVSNKGQGKVAGLWRPFEDGLFCPGGGLLSGGQRCQAYKKIGEAGA
jgi:hypothetical protein